MANLLAKKKIKINHKPINLSAEDKYQQKSFHPRQIYLFSLIPILYFHHKSFETITFHHLGHVCLHGIEFVGNQSRLNKGVTKEVREAKDVRCRCR